MIKCRKCGSTNTVTRFIPKDMELDIKNMDIKEPFIKLVPSIVGYVTKSAKEFLARRCACCNYRWADITFEEQEEEWIQSLKNMTAKWNQELNTNETT